MANEETNKADVPSQDGIDWKGFSLKEALRKRERELIGLALKAANGSVTRAAKLLGFKHHQSVTSLINTRHRDLLTERLPIRPRRRPLITKGSKHKSVQRGGQWDREAL